MVDLRVAAWRCATVFGPIGISIIVGLTARSLRRNGAASEKAGVEIRRLKHIAGLALAWERSTLFPCAPKK